MQVFGVSFDSPEANAKFAAKREFPFQLLSDSDRALAIALGLVEDASAWFAPRVTFVVSADGIIEQVIDTQSAGGQAALLLPSLR